MSAFSFINESRSKNNQTSNKETLAYESKTKQGTTANPQSGQAPSSLFIYSDTPHEPYEKQSSHHSSSLLSDREYDPWSKNFKSSFSFMNQNSSVRPVSHVVKHQPLKFSSSFIMEDFMDNDEDQVSSRSDKSMKKENINKYFSLMEDCPSSFVDKKRNGSRKGKEKLAQSMLNHSVSSEQAPLITSAFDFINQGN